MQADDINDIPGFWTWFRSHESAFRKIVLQQDDIVTKVFDPVSEALSRLHPNVLLLCGALADNTVDLVFTADGALHVIPFIEQLVAAAPKIKGWQFTALKPPMVFAGMAIVIEETSFTADDISFFANHSDAQPDLIDITVVHKDYDPGRQELFAHGCFIVLDHVLGELAFATQIDRVRIAGPEQEQQDLIPLQKLPEYLKWREKEFIERYDGIRRDDEDDAYRGLEAKTEEGLPVIAMVNATLLDWDAPASHPWILEVEYEYDGAAANGMPDEHTQGTLETLEDELREKLTDISGFLFVARETGANRRSLLIACKDFRFPAAVMRAQAVTPRDGITIQYNITKDKYWNRFDMFRVPDDEEDV